jgi:hypothetical protein
MPQPLFVPSLAAGIYRFAMRFAELFNGLTVYFVKGFLYGITTRGITLLIERDARNLFPVTQRRDALRLCT